MTESVKKKKNKWILWVFIFILGIISSLSFALYMVSPLEKEAGDNIFIVKEGQSLYRIAEELYQQQYIRNSLAFRIIYKLSDDSRSIRSGSYRISPALSTWAIYNKLLSGDQELVSVTIPEGWTLRQIAQLLDQKGVTTYDGFLSAAKDQTILDNLKIPGDNIEGFLYPDTYLFPMDYEPYYIMNLFIENFKHKMNQIYPDWRDLTDQQLYDKIIMASIVEREYRSEEEAPLISSVFYNRLDHWYDRLESCATVTYIITDIQGEPHPDRLTDREIQIDHDYNTYERSGLPPGPISNPGMIALKAAFYPAKTDYIYFVVKDQAAGTHNFSTDYEDFMEHKMLYLRNYRSK